MRKVLYLGLTILVTGALLAGTVLALAPQARKLADATSNEPEDIDLAALDNYAVRSEIYDVNGKPLGTLHGPENRQPVSLDQVPQPVIDAILAVEDADFYDHNGVNWRATARALFENVSAGGIEQGGSTITQQLVKNALLGSRARPPTQDQGGGLRDPPRAEAQQERDPREVPQHRVLRCRRLRRAGRRRDLLGRRHQRARLRRGGDARGAHLEPGRVRPDAASRGREQAAADRARPPRRARQDQPARRRHLLPHAVAGSSLRQGRAEPAGLVRRRRAAATGGLLRRRGQAGVARRSSPRCDQGGAVQRRVRWRAEDLHDPQPRSAVRRAGRTRHGHTHQRQGRHVGDDLARLPHGCGPSADRRSRLRQLQVRHRDPSTGSPDRLVVQDLRAADGARAGQPAVRHHRGRRRRSPTSVATRTRTRSRASVAPSSR